jgi:FlaA1/EpsC-like NDP-sugar epimerase
VSTLTSKWAKFGLDVGLWTIAGVLAFPLRIFDGFAEEPETIVGYAMVSLAVGAIVVFAFGLQRQSWREVVLDDLVRLLSAIGVATAVSFVIGLVWYSTSGFPRTIPLIQGTLAVVLIGGSRLGARMTHERRGMRSARSEGKHERVLVVGAGAGGVSMAREMRRHPSAGMVPVGFLDDDRGLQGMSIAGLHVLGTIDDLTQVVADRHIDLVLIAMPSSSGRRTRQVVELARQAGVSCRILPGVTEILLADDVRLTQVREVQVDDLLRRTPIELHLEEDENYIAGHTVLVTGAGGSIGSELVRQVARLDPKRMVLLGHGENSLYSIERELREALPDLDAAVVVGNVQDERKMADVMATFEPAVVFHAAAHKQVPLLEHNPDEAILNNVGGTQTIAEAALAADVRRFVNISTDKAVDPISMLGVTKAIAERVVVDVASRASRGQIFVSVRFGNVLGSRGSVVPIFQDQIDRGGPVTITDPAMARYFMTIPEASRLVIQAGSFALNGAVYVLDMGSPVRIEDLARDMIRLSGRDDDEIEIVYSGLRPGEKLTEELFSAEERPTATRYEQILVAHPEPVRETDLAGQVACLVDAARRRDWNEIDERLGLLVDGYRMGDSGHLRVVSL